MQLIVFIVVFKPSLNSVTKFGYTCCWAYMLVAELKFYSYEGCLSYIGIREQKQILIIENCFIVYCLLYNTRVTFYISGLENKNKY